MINGFAVAIRAHGARALTFMFGGIMAQGLAALSGLLLARWLSLPDYALYTILTSIMGAIAILTKGGSHMAYSAILGRVWPDITRAGEAMAAVLKMRRQISLVTLPPILAVTAWLLLNNGADKFELLLLLALLLMIWWADMRSQLVDQILFFAHQTSRVQFLDAGLAALRLGLIVGLYFGGFLSLVPAVAVGVAVSLVRIGPILSWVRNLILEAHPAPRSDDLAEMRLAVRRQLPVDVYFVLQAQIVFVVLSAFATTTDVASFGALTRINQLLAPVSMFTMAFAVPIFSRATDRLGRLLAALGCLALIPGLILMLIAAFAPGALLWLVGGNYQNLGSEVLLTAILATATYGANTLRALVAHRGWVRFNWIQIPVGVAWIATSMIVLDFSTLIGGLLLQLGFACIPAMVALIDFVLENRQRTAKNRKSCSPTSSATK